MYSLNSDNELCALHKPEGCLDSRLILGAMKTATIRSTQLHKDVDEALKELTQGSRQNGTARPSCRK